MFAQAQICSPQVDIEYLSQTFGDRLDHFHVASAAPPEVSDKWLLSSALQKLVRRGRASDAVAVAVRLHKVDPSYLRRRLPIIALEDVGLGDLSVCCDVMLACSTSRWWVSAAEQTIAFLVGKMAGAVKCRAACDALCLAEVHRDTPGIMTRLLAFDGLQLADIAGDPCKPQLERLNALRILGGISVRQWPRYVTVSRFNPAGLDRAGVTLGMPPLVRWLMARNSKTTGMAAMLPIVVELATERVVNAGDDFPHSLDMEAGVPLSALDMHSECGRGALREYFMDSPVFRAFAKQWVAASSPVRVFFASVFHIETSIVDRCLSSPGLDRLIQELHPEELCHHGLIDPAARVELERLIREDADRLASIRRRRLAMAMADESAVGPLPGMACHD